MAQPIRASTRGPSPPSQAPAVQSSPSLALLAAVQADDEIAVRRQLAELRASRADPASEIDRAASMDSASTQNWPVSEDEPLTPLMAAACIGNARMVRLLLEAGANFHHAATSGRTALMDAAAAGHAATLKALLHADARVDKALSDDGFPLISISRDEFALTLELSPLKGSIGKTALMVAAENEHIDMLQALLQVGAEIDHADPHRRTALMHVAKIGRNAALKILIQAGAKVDHADACGQTALMVAAQEGHTVTVQALIQAGAKLDRATGRGITALKLAEKRGHTAIADILRKASAPSLFGFLSFFG